MERNRCLTGQRFFASFFPANFDDCEFKLLSQKNDTPTTPPPSVSPWSVVVVPPPLPPVSLNPSPTPTPVSPTILVYYLLLLLQLNKFLAAIPIPPVASPYDPLLPSPEKKRASPRIKMPLIPIQQQQQLFYCHEF